MLSPGGRGRDPTTPELAPRSPPCHTTDRQLTGAARGPLPDDVTQMALTDKGAFCVLTVPVEAKVGLQFTLVQVCGVTGGQAGEGGGGARALPGALPRRSPAWRLSVPVSGTARVSGSATRPLSRPRFPARTLWDTLGTSSQKDFIAEDS